MHSTALDICVAWDALCFHVDHAPRPQLHSMSWMLCCTATTPCNHHCPRTRGTSRPTLCSVPCGYCLVSSLGLSQNLSSVSAPSLDMQSYDLMRLPPREATAEGDLTIPFQQSALKSTADQDPFFQHLKIRYVKAADTADHPQVCCIICGCCCLGKRVWVSSFFGLVVCKTAAGGLTQIRESRKWW